MVVIAFRFVTSVGIPGIKTLLTIHSQGTVGFKENKMSTLSIHQTKHWFLSLCLFVSFCLLLSLWREWVIFWLKETKEKYCWLGNQTKMNNLCDSRCIWEKNDQGYFDENHSTKKIFKNTLILGHQSTTSRSWFGKDRNPQRNGILELIACLFANFKEIKNREMNKNTSVPSVLWFVAEQEKWDSYFAIQTIVGIALNKTKKIRIKLNINEW